MDNFTVSTADVASEWVHVQSHSINGGHVSNRRYYLFGIRQWIDSYTRSLLFSNGTIVFLPGRMATLDDDDDDNDNAVFHLIHSIEWSSWEDIPLQKRGKARKPSLLNPLCFSS